MVPVKTNSNWLPSIFNDFFENEWLAKTGVTAPAINVIENGAAPGGQVAQQRPRPALVRIHLLRLLLEPMCLWYTVCH